MFVREPLKIELQKEISKGVNENKEIAKYNAQEHNRKLDILIQNTSRDDTGEELNLLKFNKESRVKLIQANEYVDSKEYTKGIEIYNNILRSDTELNLENRIDLYRQRVKVYFKKKDWKNAQNASSLYLSYLNSLKDKKYNIDIAYAYMEYGQAYYWMGENKKAREKFGKAKSFFEKLYNTPHKNTAWTLSWIGDTYKRKSNNDANETYTKALTIYLDVKNEKSTNSNDNIPYLYSQLAYARGELGDNNASIKNSLLAIQEYEKININSDGKYNIRLAWCYHNLAYYYAKEMRNNEALKNYKKSLELYKHGNYPVKIAQIYRNLYDIYHRMGKKYFKNAEKSLKNAIGWYKKANNKDNTNKYDIHIAKTYCDLGWLYQNKDKNEVYKIIENYSACIDLKKKLDPKKHLIDVVWSQRNLANYYFTNEKYTNAEKIYREALKNIETVVNEYNQTKYVKELAWTYADVAASMNSQNDSNQSEIYNLHVKACANQYYLACKRLGIMYREGEGTQKDCKKAKDKFKLACENGIDDACTHIGHLYEIGCGVKQDHKEAFDRYDRLCENNNSWACSKQAWMYSVGKGIDKNVTKAFELYDKACNAEHYYSCSKVGEMYRDAKGVKQDFKKANKKFELACENNEQDGCTNIAYNFEFAKGVEHDYQKALEGYKKSCDNNNGWGCNNLGALYQRGNAVEKDMKKAFNLYKKSCDFGFTHGCTNLMKLYTYNDKFDNKKDDVIKSYTKLKHMLGDDIANSSSYEAILGTLKKIHKYDYKKLKEITHKFIDYLTKLDSNVTIDLGRSHKELSKYNRMMGKDDLAIKNIDNALIYYRQLDSKVYSWVNEVIESLLLDKANIYITLGKKDTLSTILSEVKTPLILDTNKLKFNLYKKYLKTGAVDTKILNKLNNNSELHLDKTMQYLGHIVRLNIQGLDYMQKKEYLKAFKKYKEAFEISIREYKLYPLEYLSSITNNLDLMASVSMSSNFKSEDVLKDIDRVTHLFIDANNTEIYGKYISNLFFIKSELLGVNDPKYKQLLEKALEHNKAEPKNDKYYKYIIDINNNLGYYYQIRGQVDEAEKKYEISLENISKIKAEKDRTIKEYVSKYNKSIIFMLKHRYSNALLGFKDALMQYKEFVSKYKIKVDYNTLTELKSKILIMHIALNNEPAFKKEYSEFIKFYNDYSNNIHKYLRVYIRDFASRYVDEDRVEQAIELYVKFIENFKNEKYLKDNDLSVYEIVRERNYLIELYGKNNDYSSAIKNLKKMILLYKDNKEYDYAIPDIYKELGKSYMHISIDDKKNAIKYYIKAIEGYKSIIKLHEAENDVDSSCYIEQQKLYIANLEQCVSKIDECIIKLYHIAYDAEGCTFFTEKEWEALKVDDELFEQHSVDANDTMTEAVEPIR